MRAADRAGFHFSGAKRRKNNFMNDFTADRVRQNAFKAFITDFDAVTFVFGWSDNKHRAVILVLLPNGPFTSKLDCHNLRSMFLPVILR